MMANGVGTLEEVMQVVVVLAEALQHLMDHLVYPELALWLP